MDEKRLKGWHEGMGDIMAGYYSNDNGPGFAVGKSGCIWDVIPLVRVYIPALPLCLRVSLPGETSELPVLSP